MKYCFVVIFIVVVVAVNVFTVVHVVVVDPGNPLQFGQN